MPQTVSVPETSAELSALTVIWRGWRKTCPNCGQAPLYRKYLKQVDACASCAVPLGQIRADDLPPYLTILVVGHIIVPSIVMAEKYLAPPTWAHTITWLPLTLGLMLWFLPRLKGCAIGVMCKLGLKGDEQQGVEEKQTRD
jgi:uncharacterized protein (DUF983 family)